MNEQDKPIILSIENLSLSVEDKLLFHDLCLDVFQGDRVGIIGPNGSGKTTLFRTILGQQIPAAGSLKLANHLLCEVSLQERGNYIGYLPQGYESIPPLSIFEFLYSCAEQKQSVGKLIELEVEVLLAKLRLSGKSKQLLPTLSGGELRRVFLGAALLGDPKLLLLDEPLTSLDSEGRGTMVEVVQAKLQDDVEATAIIISHDEEFLSDFCTRIYQVVRGALVDLSVSENISEIEEIPPKEWLQ